ncbi:hypothetical protein AAG570_006745 [Ranatra chinensis]|uniref:Reverse transcriptase domain-containing protein n=1 Tax=Ranatra chinensis TaxID=642074 RepID=A0ABD0ZBY2_9HEMI
MPMGTYQEAIESLTKAENLTSKPWKQNKLLLAKCYIKLEDTSNARLWLIRAKNVETITRESYLNNRYSVVCLDDKLSEYIQIKVSVPQGSVLGPLLYLIYSADIPTQTLTHMATFADDISGYCRLLNLGGKVGENFEASARDQT